MNSIHQNIDNPTITADLFYPPWNPAIEDFYPAAEIARSIPQDFRVMMVPGLPKEAAAWFLRSLPVVASYTVTLTECFSTIQALLGFVSVFEPERARKLMEGFQAVAE